MEVRSDPNDPLTILLPFRFLTFQLELSKKDHSGKILQLEQTLMDEEILTKTGKLEHIVWIDRSEDNGYMVADFLEKETKIPIRIVVRNSKLSKVQVQDELLLKGKFQNHEKYGDQFTVTSFTIIEPTSRDGIIRTLSKIKGIGEKTAKRIVEMFGEKTFEVINESPYQLLKIKRFNRKQLKSIEEENKRDQEEQKTDREIDEFKTKIQHYVKSWTLADKIFDKFKWNSINIITKTPYRLTEVISIGFLKADEIALSLEVGVKKNSPERASAVITYMLKQQVINGHTCFPRHELIDITLEKWGIHHEIVEFAVKQLINDNSIEIFKEKKIENEIIEMVSGWSINNKEPYYDIENRIAQNLNDLLNNDSLTYVNVEKGLVSRQEKRLGIKLDSIQHLAIREALQKKVMIITGGPGTGKTTLVRFIIGVLISNIKDKGAMALAAPTGRAAKRLTETTGEDALTIHRLLEFGHIKLNTKDNYQKEDEAKFGFKRNRANPLVQQMLIIDETSMVDTELMDALIEAVPLYARLVLVGDVDQLPSVGPGKILRDLIESKFFPVIKLEHIYRRSVDSLITIKAHKVRKGKWPIEPKTPGNLRVKVNNSSIILAWEPSSKANSYNLYWDNSSGISTSDNLIKRITGANYTHDNLKKGKTYFYKIAAVNSNGISNLSPEVSATPSADQLKTNTQKVKQSLIPYVKKTEHGELKEFYFIRENDPKKIVEKIIEMVSNRIPKRYGFNSLTEIQVLTPMHRGPTGSIQLNQRIQSELNPNGDEYQHREKLLKIGDKVMQQHNNYEKEIFNGEMGIIKECHPTGEIHVEFDEIRTDIVYKKTDLDQISLAYAISVHKSQGSEYPAVILPLTTHHFIMLKRNLLYTAMTRGKQLVVLIGTEQAIHFALKNKEAHSRHTSLAYQFQELKQLMTN